MRKEEKDIEKRSRSFSNFREIEKLHPHQMIAFLMLFGSFLILVFLLVSLTIEVAGPNQGIKSITIPKFLIFSTIVLSFTYNYFGKLSLGFILEDSLYIKKQLLGTLAIGTLLITMQFSGWLEFIYQGITFSENITGTYLYIITGLFIIHLLVGVSLTFIVLIQIQKIHNDAIRQLIYFTAPYEKLKLEILSMYWRFQIFLWVFIAVWLIIIF